MLIKSFEGFRPRAMRREDGGWTIGYGHTLSAREGASVSEADAELLLRYDLLPVEKAVNETIPAVLNQHQFDALVSFVSSVGVERFAGSDVRRQLAAGAPAEAAEAMMGWPEPPLRDTALRRRAAERALFVADPAGPVALSDLLAAPLPQPAQTGPSLDTAADDPIGLAEETPGPLSPVSEETPAAADSRTAAVAALLGEPHDPGTSETRAAPVIPTFSLPVPGGADADLPAPAPVVQDDAGLTQIADAADPASEPQQVLSGVEPESQPEAVTDASPSPAPAGRTGDPVAMAVARYAPYSASMVGPLPYLQPAAPRKEAMEPVERVITAEPADKASDVTEPQVAAAEIADVAVTLNESLEPEAEPANAEASSPAEVGPAPVAGETEVEITPVAPPADTAVAALVLTPLDDTAQPDPARPLWGPEQRAGLDAPLPADSLFGEDLSLTRDGGPLLRHEVEPEAAARFDWSETGAFIIMGAVGLTAFGASMAAFRLASEQSNGGTETTMIAWVLAIIGGACVGVSSFNLYRRWGLPGGD